MMKMYKKLLAGLLAGVLMLSVLSGCEKSSGSKGLMELLNQKLGTKFTAANYSADKVADAYLTTVSDYLDKNGSDGDAIYEAFEAGKKSAFAVMGKSEEDDSAIALICVGSKTLTARQQADLLAAQDFEEIYVLENSPISVIDDNNHLDFARIKDRRAMELSAAVLEDKVWVVVCVSAD